jgi:hypothetical protein
MTDNVNHPKHFTSDPSGIECIQITRHRNFNIGNAIKYLWRAGLKDETKHIEDLRKAVWYIEDEIKRLEKLRTEKLETYTTRGVERWLSTSGLTAEQIAEYMRNIWKGQ